MSVQPTSITVMLMLSVITLMDLITAHAALDTLEMEHHAVVNYQAKCILGRGFTTTQIARSSKRGNFD